MKKILFLCVTYNSYKETLDFVASVDRAAEKAKGLFDVTVAVGDNTVSNIQALDVSSFRNVDVRVFPYNNNLGYLGCAFKMMDDLGYPLVHTFDYWSISNVDLQISSDFLVNLSAIDLPDAGWLAPDVYTPRLDTHDNPFMMSRPTNKDFLKWKIMYCNATVFRFLENLAASRRSRRIEPVNHQKMYAGHGSIMIFTKLFLDHYDNLRYPAFMYTEEIFFAELLRRCQLSVYYCSELAVTNIGSVSISTLGDKWHCEQCRKSIAAVRKMFNF